MQHHFPTRRFDGKTISRRRSYTNRVALARFVVLALVVAVAASAGAWPLSRGGPTREGRVDGSLGIREPAVRWLLPVGGDTNARRWAAVDRNADGVDEIAIIRGGRVVLRESGGTLLWSTAPLGVEQIIAVADLDQDGRTEIWARSRLLLVSLDATTGAVRWLRDFTGPYLGAVRPMTTANGEQLLYVADSGCSMNGAGTARLYRPAGDGRYEELAVLDTSAHGYWCGISDEFGDVDGDGEPEIVTLSDHEVVVYTRAGEPRWRLEVGRVPHGVGQVAVADVDGDGRDEIVVATNNVVEGVSAKRVMLVELEQGALALRWSFEAGLDDAVRIGPPLVADVAQDARPEIVASVLTGNAWTTYVWSGTATAANQTLATRSGVLLGIDGDGLVLADTSLAVPGFGPVRREVLRGPASGTSWSIADALPAIRSADWSGHDALVLHGGSVLLLRDTDGDRRADEASLSDGTIIMPAGAVETPIAAMSLSDGRLALSRSDGRIAVYRGAVLDNPYQELAEPALFEPNILTRTLVTSVISEDRHVVVADGAGAVLGYSPHGSGSARVPALRWKLPGVLAGQSYARWLPSPVAFTGTHLVGPYRRRDGALTFDTYEPRSGAQSSSIMASPESTSTPQFDPVPYGTGILFSWRDATFATHTTTDGPSVSVLDTLINGNSESPISVADVTGDGLPDAVVLQNGRLRVVDGSTGQLIRDVAVGSALGLVSIVDLDDDQSLDYLIHGAFTTTRVSLDGTVVWRHGAGVAHLPAAIASTPSGKRVAVPSFDVPRLVVLDASTGDELGSVVLASGAAHASEEAAVAAGASLGQISAALGVDDLTGQGEPGVLVGSSDGYLYALKLAPLELAWALDFRATVGEPIAADLDGDGIHEVLVPVGDGHVAVVTNADLPSPTGVFESDCRMAPGSDGDLDEISIHGPLSVSWLPVPGATGYRVLVLREDGVVVVQWTDVGNVTAITLSGIAFEEGQRYEVRVSAYADGPQAPLVSGEARSDGFIAVAADACLVDPGSRSGGCCSTAEPFGKGGLGSLLLAVICALSIFRRHGGKSRRTGSSRSSSL